MSVDHALARQLSEALARRFAEAVETGTFWEWVAVEREKAEAHVRAAGCSAKLVAEVGEHFATAMAAAYRLARAEPQPDDTIPRTLH